MVVARAQVVARARAGEVKVVQVSPGVAKMGGEFLPIRGGQGAAELMVALAGVDKVLAPTIPIPDQIMIELGGALKKCVRYANH